MARIVSGIQPTGDLHIGNYLGAIRNWVELQDKEDCIYFVADLHALTADYDKKAMPSRIFELAAGLLACGVDPDKATLFVQSEIKEHSELCWMLACVTPMGELSRQTQYKSKSETAGDGLNVGLFTYPVLQAADILLYQASAVPVGADQQQHLELTREIARKFNARFGRVFREPQALLTSTPKIVGLDGQAKMSKSLGNHIGVMDPPKTVEKKLARAFTDPNRKQRSDPGNPSVCNVFALHGFFSDTETCSQLDSACRKAAIGCVDCKKQLAAAINSNFEPIQQKWHELRAAPQQVHDVLDQGRSRCAAIANETMAKVGKKTRLGLERSPA